MEVLFIGGSGIISSACSRLAVERGIELSVLNRGRSQRLLPDATRILRGDIRDRSSAEAILRGKTFDAVVDWVAFTPDHIRMDLELFHGKVGQFIFISSASVYQTPPTHLPVTESTPLCNPVWKYSQDKIACEDALTAAYREHGFPMTIVRPSHTYDATLLPMHGGFTIVDRMRKGKEVIVHGDGSSLWTLTHHRDFARGFIGLLGNPLAIGEAFHITSEEWLTWNQIFDFTARAAGVEPKLVPIPSALIATYDKDWGDSLLGDKTHSMIFDNSKIRRLVPDFLPSIPYRRGAEEIIAWYDSHPEACVVDADLDRRIDAIIATQRRALPGAG